MAEQIVKGIVAKIPEGYYKPSGKKIIRTTEELNVRDYATAQVYEPNLIPENIAKDVKVLGIVGTHEGGGGIDTSDATASANDLLLGKTAYVDGEKIVGKIQYYTNDKAVVSSYSGTTIATNGKYIPYDLRIELDASLIPSGSLSVTTNGTYDVTKFASVNVSVAMPEGYLKPSGTFETSVEGTYNVSTYATATFSVQKEELNVTPSSDVQTLTPSANKFYNKVVVQPIPSDYVVPSGTLEVTENGEHDVATYEKVNVNVASSGGNTLKTLLDNTKTCYHLFYNYDRNNIADLIQYNDTENVTTMNNMFQKSTSLTTIPLLDTSKVTNMSSMFSGCTKLTSVPQLDTSSVDTITSMFDGCKALTTIPQLNTSNVDRLDYIFRGCELITSIPQLDTSKVTRMTSMFDGCKALTSIPLLNTSKVDTIEYMFRGCTSLTTIPLLDTSAVNYMSNMFSGCTKLTSVPALNVSKVSSMNNIFSQCSSLKSILMYGMKVKFDISASTQFEASDLVVILNNLATITSTQTLTMGATNLAKLTDEEKAIATNKGWTLA